MSARKRRPFAPVVAAAALLVPLPAHADGSAVAQAADAAAQRLMTAQHVPGVALAVVKNGTVVYERGYGFADAAKKTPVTADTRFEIGSITKQFTAACVLQLARAGKLSLEAPLSTYVPEYAPGAAVTVRQLLSQTSGIPEYLDGSDAVRAAGKPGTLAVILARIAGKPLEFAPGTRWQYSNTNYVLLGTIVERAAGRPYAAYVRDRIFAPAGMTQSGFIGDEARLPQMASGYALGASGAEPAPPLRDEWAFGAGNIVSTLGDMLKWNRALASGAIVPPDDVTLMRTSAVLSNGIAAGYGYGWVVDRTGKHRRIWHNGGTFGFRTANVTYPDDGESVVVLTNLADANPEAVAQAIFAADHPDVAQVAAAAGEDVAVTTRVAEWLHRFETADIDRAQLTPEMSAALTPALVSAVRTQFAPLGDPKALVFTGKTLSGALSVYTYVATFANGRNTIIMALTPDGKIAGYRVTGAD